MGAPQISVVIAAFEAERTLGRQLAALAAQRLDTALEWEVLVCDNGSTDGTAALVRDLPERPPGLRLVDASHRRGPGAARNAGARAALAPLLAFCDADDEVDPGWVAAMLRALGGADVVAGLSRRPEYNSRPDSPEYFTWQSYRVPFFPYLRAANGGNLGVRRDSFLAVGGFDEELRTGEDLDLCWRLQLAGHALVDEPAALVTFSNRPTMRASIAQTFAYGVGNRRLRRKYARVEAAFRALGTEPAAVPSVPPVPSVPSAPSVPPVPSVPSAPSVPPVPSVSVAPASTLARAWRKARRLRRLSDLTLTARAVATWAGYQAARLGRRGAQVDPPAVLPPG